LDREFSIDGERGVGIFMLCLFIFGFLSLMANEWCALFKQIRKLDTSQNSFPVGLRTAAVGFLLLFLPEKLIKNLKKWLPEDTRGKQTGDVNRLCATPSNRESRSSSTPDNKPWLKQLREMAKASFKEGSSSAGNDPSSSYTTRSGFWRGTGSGSSSKASSGDFKSRPRNLYKDLEAIFASNK